MTNSLEISLPVERARCRAVPSLPAFVESVGASIDGDPDAFWTCSDAFTALTRSTFLPDLVAWDYLTAELQSWKTFQPTNSYTAQTLMLAQRGRFAVRANIWEPPGSSSELRAHQKALYYYQVPHDHNFSFLTVGYVGPGYETLIYERDPDAVVGLPGESVTCPGAPRHQAKCRSPESRPASLRMSSAWPRRFRIPPLLRGFPPIGALAVGSEADERYTMSSGGSRLRRSMPMPIAVPPANGALLLSREGEHAARGGDHPTGLTIEVLSPSVSRLRALALLYAFVFFMVAVFPVLSSRPDRASLSGSSMSSPLSCQVLSLEDLCH